MGFLDTALRGVATDVIGMFSDNTSAFTVVTHGSYDPVTGTEVQESTTYNVKVSPPTRVRYQTALTGESAGVVGTDLVVFVSAKDVEEAGFSILPDRDKTVSLTVAGRTFKVVTVFEVWSGDQVALLEVVIRG